MLNLFEWFSQENEKQLACQMVKQLTKSLPAKLMNERLDVLSAKKVTRHLEESYALAKEHQSRHKIGMFKRAVLANAFRWELKAAGYSENFIGVATEGLIVELTPAKKSSAS